MELEEKNMINTILEDVKDLKDRVDGMEGMLETLVDIFTDAFYVVKKEYLEKLEEIRKEGGEVFGYIEEFDRYFE